MIPQQFHFFIILYSYFFVLETAIKFPKTFNTERPSNGSKYNNRYTKITKITNSNH